MMKNKKRCVNCEHRYEEDGNLIFTSKECKQCAGFITDYRNFKEKIELPKCRCTIGVAKMKKKDIYNKAKQVYGIDNQVNKANEELSELIKELSRFLIDDGNMGHITEEMADVEIMIEQLKLIFENKRAVKVVKKDKIQRLSDRLDEEVAKIITKSCGNCNHVNFKKKSITCEKYSCNNYSEWEYDAD